MSLPTVRSFERRLAQATTGQSLKHLVAELDDPSRFEFAGRERNLVAAATSDVRTWADAASVAKVAPVKSTRNQIVQRAADTSKLTTPEDVGEAIGLIARGHRGAAEAASAVREAAKPMLAGASRADANGLVAIVLLAHQIGGTPERHKQISDAVVERATAIFPTAATLAEFSKRIVCPVVRNRLLVAFARKLRDAGALGPASTITLLDPVSGNMEDNNFSAPRSRRDILGMLAPNLPALDPSEGQLRELARFVDQLEVQGAEDDPDKPENPEAAEEAIISLLLPHLPTVRRVLEAGAGILSPSMFHHLLTAFVEAQQLPISEDAAIALAYAAFEGVDGCEELLDAIDHSRAEAEPGSSIRPLVAKLKGRGLYSRAKFQAVFGGKDVPAEVIAGLEEIAREL